MLYNILRVACKPSIKVSSNALRSQQLAQLPSTESTLIAHTPLRHVRTTRSSTHSHPFQALLPNPRTLSHKSSFIPRTCSLWNVLPSPCFPESYNLPSFKSKINRLDLISLSSNPFAFFFLPLLRHCIGDHGLSPT